ncbi:MAG TPA: hypothetical protein VLJ14_14700, partial [Ktedonobacterales bacterium]|nr:hypothetical protein [Ktedonobacterales bacterium]
ETIGTSVERNGAHLLPLPHPSGVSRWLNAPAHQALLARALALLAGWREEWEAEDRARERRILTPQFYSEEERHG